MNAKKVVFMKRIKPLLQLFFTLILTFHVVKAYSQEEILVRFETFEINRQFRFTTGRNFDFDSVVMTFKSVKSEGLNRAFRTEFNVPKSRVVRNNVARLNLWIKRKYWFGWEHIEIGIEYQKGIPLRIEESFIHKHRYRYVPTWSDRLPLD
jgi:hypothetical protein